MATEPYRHPGFGGLQMPATSHSPQAPTLSGRLEGGSAVDGAAQAAGYNVTTRGLGGGVRTRPGTVGTVKSNYTGIVYKAWDIGNVRVLCATKNGSGVNGLEVINTFSGSITWSNTNSKWTSEGIATDMVVWDQESSPQDLALLVNGNSLLQVNLATLTFTDPSVDAGSLVAIAPWSPRLVTADFRGTQSAGHNTKTIRFSQPDTPLTFSASDWVDLPGQEETFLALEAWGDYLFLVTTDRILVFYGESTDSDGATEFLYREVGDRRAGNYQGAHVTPDGLLVYGGGGVWLTNGGPPVPVSAPIEGLFLDGTIGWPDFEFQGRRYDTDVAHRPMGIHFDGVDFITVRFSRSGYLPTRAVLVREPGNTWQLWGGFDPEGFLVIEGGDTANLRSGQTLLFHRKAAVEAAPDPHAAKHALFALSDEATSDAPDFAAGDSVPVDSWYHSGWMTLSSTDVKSIRELKITGRGTAKIEVAIDYELVTDPGVEVIFGDTTTRRFEIKTVRGRGATVRGTYLAFALRSVAGAPFHVKDVTYMLRATRTHGIPKVDR